ncbi:hypothetical protein [Methylocystis bryophila]|uniref:Cytochrome c domain-containing protein n=1 Tax=Methylocystis bryophila TaxID=655015 RepID=A0A1W6MRR5_9HYPH|nr:hypothetical protein [Methylocystis bryophila]ARN80257.1 hypothetical protein B1812_03215 [Methylocystis bryophila]
MTMVSSKVFRIFRWTLAILALLGLVVIALLTWAYFALVAPRWSEFGTVKDEAMRAGLTRKNFPAADDEYFAKMDKGLLVKPSDANSYPPEIQQIASIAKLTPEEVRKSAIRGQNGWIVWTGGNDRFWDYAARNLLGVFDLLKILSSHKSQYYGRHNRWAYLGLVNEPCYSEADAPDPSRYGLWLDRRDPSCPADPFADAKKYPGVKVGSRGQTQPVGSYYGEPSGIVGLRLFPNPDFDEAAQARWDADRYYNDPSYYNDPNLVRPYRVGMSCAFCHVGPNPINPPTDPENPAWENLTSNPGAQYYWVDRIFFWDTRPRGKDGAPTPNEGNFLYQLFHTSPPGALDTSLVSSDYMNNPRTMNAVYNTLDRLVLAERWGKEKLAGGELDNKQFGDYALTSALGSFWDPRSGEVHTMRVLKDGSDAVGALGAFNRVYLNIGLFSEEWLLHFNPFVGGRKITPIKISDAERNSAYWGATEDMTPDMAVFFLTTGRADKLKDAPNGASYLQPYDSEIVKRGKLVFAENCAACHSSKIPPAPANSGIDDGICAGGGAGPEYRQCWDRYWQWAQSPEFKREMVKRVLEPGPDGKDFLDGNYLSTERRIPLDLVQVNACGPLASNALKDDVWNDFSSDTYKTLPPVKPVTINHPVSGAPSSFQPLGNGRGYFRPASLVSVWSTAPFLSNNSLGLEEPKSHAYRLGGEASRKETEPYRADPYKTVDHCPSADPDNPDMPCVENRLRQFDRSIHELLYPERRRRDPTTAAPGYMYRTTAPTCIRAPKEYTPALARSAAGLLHWAAPWVFQPDGAVALGPLPKDFPINALTNTKLLPDNDETDMLGHVWKLARAAPTIISAFSQFGGACSAEELADPGTQVRAERVVRETGLLDTLIGISKCPDYVVNRGHYFGADLPAADKEALIEYIKHF